jgi:hypothetical protein
MEMAAVDSRQRILAALTGSRVDRIPWIPLLSGSYFASLPEYRRKFAHLFRAGYIHPQFNTFSDVLDALAFRVGFYRSIGADYMHWGATPPWDVENDAVSTRVEERGVRTLVHYETAIGSLTQEQHRSLTAKTIFPVDSLLKSVEDYRVYAFILRHSRIVPRHDRLQQYLDVIGNGGVAFIYTPSPPIKDWLLNDILLKDLVFALVDHPQELAEVETLGHTRNMELCRILASSPGRVFMDYAVTGTGMISPRIFREHYLGYTKQYAKILHEKGKTYLNHASGEPLRAILSMVADSGVDGLYGISLPKFGHGDATLAEIRSALGPDVTVIAGIEPHILATGTEQDIKEATRYALDQCVQIGGRVMLGTVDDTPYGTPPRNLAAVSEVVEKYHYLT